MPHSFALLWSCVAFFGLASNNLLAFVDFTLPMGTDLALARTIAGASAMLVLLYRLIWEAGR